MLQNDFNKVRSQNLRVLYVKNLENQVHSLPVTAACKSQEEDQPFLVVNPVVAVFIHNSDYAIEDDLGQI